MSLAAKTPTKREDSKAFQVTSACLATKHVLGKRCSVVAAPPRASVQTVTGDSFLHLHVAELAALAREASMHGALAVALVETALAPIACKENSRMLAWVFARNALHAPAAFRRATLGRLTSLVLSCVLVAAD